MGERVQHRWGHLYIVERKETAACVIEAAVCSCLGVMSRMEAANCLISVKNIGAQEFGHHENYFEVGIA